MISQSCKLTEHRQYNHNSCGQCEYHANSQFVLSKHRQYIHNYVGYASGQCEYQVTTNINLKDHRYCNHNEVHIRPVKVCHNMFKCLSRTSC